MYFDTCTLTAVGMEQVTSTVAIARVQGRVVLVAMSVNAPEQDRRCKHLSIAILLMASTLMIAFGGAAMTE